MPGMKLDAVELTERDVDSIKYVIKMATSDTDLTNFAFSMNHIVVKEVELEGETTGSEGSGTCHLSK